MPYTTLRVVRRDFLPEDGASLSGELALHPVLRRIYVTRGVRTPADLDTSLERLHPVGTLEGVPAAVDLLMQHRTGRVLIVGDFDADGATSTALMVRALTAGVSLPWTSWSRTASSSAMA